MHTLKHVALVITCVLIGYVFPFIIEKDVQLVTGCIFVTDNVHFQNSAQLIKALTDKDVYFKTLVSYSQR